MFLWYQPKWKSAIPHKIVKWITDEGITQALPRIKCGVWVSTVSQSFNVTNTYFCLPTTSTATSLHSFYQNALSLPVAAFVVTFNLSLSQADWESNGGLVKKLPSIREDEEGDEEQNSVCRAPRSPLRLGRGLSSPLRSPLLKPQPFRTPSEHSCPTTLQLPVVSFRSAPPELSPR